MSSIPSKTLIGRIDKVDFPALGLFNLDVKIDTGAYTSSMHCDHIELEQEPGARTVRFHLLDHSHADYDGKIFELPVSRLKMVRSSSGTVEQRIFIKTNIMIFGELFNIELSLTDRSDMRFPVLLGRRVLRNRYLVDVNRINLSYRQKLAGRRHAQRKNP